MTDPSLLGPWVRRFLLEHLVGERNLARNTQQSYRDTLRLLLPFVARTVRRPIDRLRIEDLSPDRIRAFLKEVEDKRGCGVATRNQRLAAIHSLAHFMGRHSPEHIEWCGQVRVVPFKKAPVVPVCYLEKQEMDALLAAPDVNTTQGCRDQALLLIGDLQLGLTPERDLSAVLLRGKGNKLRRCPLWAKTVGRLRPLVSN